MRVKANGLVLQWARTEAGLELPEAADALGMALDKLGSLEAGDEDPELGVLRRMAKTYGRPLAALAMPTPPPPTSKPEDFRTVGGTAPRLSPSALLTIRVIQERQANASEVLSALSDLAPAIALPVATLQTDVAVLATGFRERVGVSIDDQLSWPSTTEAFRVWRWRIESLGVLVFSSKLPRDDCRGFSLWLDQNVPPAVFVNSQEADEARCFTLLHEVAHIALRRTGICLELDRRVDAVKVERFSNLFAAHTLMPLEAVRRVMLEVNGRIEKHLWDVDALYRMARRLRVSGLALALRLEELDLAPAGFYSKLEAARGSEIWRGRAFGRAKHPERVLSRLGNRYTGLVLTALERSAITKVEAFRLLGTPAGYFPSLHSLMTDRRQRYGP